MSYIKQPIIVMNQTPKIIQAVLERLTTSSPLSQKNMARRSNTGKVTDNLPPTLQPTQHPNYPIPYFHLHHCILLMPYHHLYSFLPIHSHQHHCVIPIHSHQQYCAHHIHFHRPHCVFLCTSTDTTASFLFTHNITTTSFQFYPTTTTTATQQFTKCRLSLPPLPP